MVGVGDDRDVHLAESSVLAWLVDPCQMREDRVGRGGQNHSVDGLELFGALREGDDLGGADEGEVERVEEQHDVLALVVGQRHVDELSVNDGLGLELRGWLANERLRHLNRFEGLAWATQGDSEGLEAKR